MIKRTLPAGLTAAVVTTLFAFARADDANISIIENRIAIFIHIIATDLLSGRGGVTSGKPIFGTGPPATTGTPLILFEAGRAQRLDHRIIGAITGAGSEHTLTRLVAFRCGHDSAFVVASILAIMGAFTRTAAKRPATIGGDQTAVPGRETVGSVTAWQTEAGKTGATNVDDVGKLNFPERTLKSWRAFLGTVPPTNPLPFVENAKSAETFIIGLARTTKFALDALTIIEQISAVQISGRQVTQHIRRVGNIRRSDGHISAPKIALRVRGNDVLLYTHPIASRGAAQSGRQ